MDSIVTTTVLKMMQGKGIGCFAPGIMTLLKLLVGSCMVFLHDK
jgi:hypothetical protein